MDPLQRIPTLHELKLAARVERARALFGPGGYLPAGGKKSSQKASASELRIPNGRTGDAIVSQSHARNNNTIEGSSSVPSDRRETKEGVPVKEELELASHDSRRGAEKEAVTRTDRAQRSPSPSASPIREPKQPFSEGTPAIAAATTETQQQAEQRQQERAQPEIITTSVVDAVPEQHQPEHRPVRVTSASSDHSAAKLNGLNTTPERKNYSETNTLAADDNVMADGGTDLMPCSALSDRNENEKGLLTTVTFTIVGGRPGGRGFNSLQQKGKVIT